MTGDGWQDGTWPTATWLERRLDRRDLDVGRLVGPDLARRHLDRPDLARRRLVGPDLARRRLVGPDLARAHNWSCRRTVGRSDRTGLD